jgi:RHS repeat-associated protein
MVEEDVIQGSTSTTSRYAYDDWNRAKAGAIGNAGHAVWAVMNSGNTLTTHYMDGDVPGQHFVEMNYSGTTFTSYYYLADQQGSIRDVVNGSGTFVDQVTYGAYGNITTESHANYRGIYGWDGYMTDTSSKLDLVNARVYDPSTGRWMSQDPMGFNAGDSNLYRYVHNQPTVMTDPSGFQQIGEGFIWAASLKPPQPIGPPVPPWTLSDNAKNATGGLFRMTHMITLTLPDIKDQKTLDSFLSKYLADSNLKRNA